MIKCSECGYENMDGLDYCDGCGAKLAAPAHTEAAAPAAETAAPESAPQPAPVMADGGEKSATGEPQPVPPEAPQAPTAPMEAPAPTPAPAPSAAAGAPIKARLRIKRGGNVGREFPLEAGNNLVGRWDPESGSFPEVDMEQDDPEAKISRKHALIRVEDSKITVEDIGSLNGTYVNRGARLTPGNPIELKTGDEIIVGKTFFELVVDPVS